MNCFRVCPPCDSGRIDVEKMDMRMGDCETGCSNERYRREGR